MCEHPAAAGIRRDFFSTMFAIKSKVSWFALRGLLITCLSIHARGRSMAERPFFPFCFSRCGKSAKWHFDPELDHRDHVRCDTAHPHSAHGLFCEEKLRRQVCRYAAATPATGNVLHGKRSVGLRPPALSSPPGSQSELMNCPIGKDISVWLWLTCWMVWNVQWASALTLHPVCNCMCTLDAGACQWLRGPQTNCPWVACSQCRFPACPRWSFLSIPLTTVNPLSSQLRAPPPAPSPHVPISLYCTAHISFSHWPPAAVWLLLLLLPLISKQRDLLVSLSSSGILLDRSDHLLRCKKQTKENLFYLVCSERKGRPPPRCGVPRNEWWHLLWIQVSCSPAHGESAPPMFVEQVMNIYLNEIFLNYTLLQQY